MGYQDSGNRSRAFYFGSCHENNRGSNKPIQKNVGIVLLRMHLRKKFEYM